ncbi:MAG: dihydroorotase [Clostridia bacterium]|nr:dihydroorotase [Clostridia bacterium]
MTKTKRNAMVYRGGFFSPEEVSLDVSAGDKGGIVSENSEYYVFPGFADVHVHLREPGFSYKETVKTGTRAAAHGGYTAVCPMANLDPVPDSREHLDVQLDCIRRDACVDARPMGAITVGENGQVLADLEAMAEDVAGFSDDGRGVADAALMREAMVRAKALGKIIVAHCEDLTYAPADPRSEWSEVERDILLAKETGAALHVCHVSSAVSLELIRQAKKDGIDVTCETGPHYLLLDETMRADSGNWKMNPPLRAPADREALIVALHDGTVDMIATDHAPHSAEEKAKGFAGSLNGIVGLECAFPVLYTGLVKPGILTLEKLIALMSDNPRRRFSLGAAGYEHGDCTVWALNEKTTVDAAAFASMGRSTPFDGMEVFGKCIATFWKGRCVWNAATTEN